MSRDQRRRLLRQLRDTGFGVDGGSPSLPLDIGPPGRRFYAGWPEYEARMLAEWNRYRDALIASCAPGPRPWALFWFDVPHVETMPGETRERNLAAGRLTAKEAEMMQRTHAQYAMARLVESRRGDSVATAS